MVVVPPSGEVLPYRIEHDHEAVLPWATMDNGAVVYWVTDPSGESDDWMIAINEARGPRRVYADRAGWGLNDCP